MRNKQEDIALLEADIEKIKENNSYGLTKVKNVICERQDLDNLLFIARNLKEGLRIALEEYREA